MQWCINKVYFFHHSLYTKVLDSSDLCVSAQNESFPVGPNYEINWYKNVKISKDVSL